MRCLQRKQRVWWTTLSVDLGYAATLAPKETVAYFRAKGQHIGWNWYETAADVHARSFTVAKAARVDVLTTIQTEVERAISQGVSQQEFIDTLSPRLKKLGWWGKQVIVDSAGNAEEVQLGSPRRLALIYNVNTRVAYNVGRYAQLMNSTDTHPFWQYVAVMDSRTRPSHAALNGLVFRYDDPFWKTHYPPNGWNCRCRVRALSQERMNALGLQATQGDKYLTTKKVQAAVDKATGEMIEMDVTTFADGARVMTPDAGWSYNPGSAAFGLDQSLIRKLIEVKSPQLREMVVQEMNNSPERQLAFRIWAKNIMETRRGGNDIRTLGFMSESVADAVAERTGEPPARLLAMSEKNLLHADSDKHHDTGVALTADDLALLPSLLARAEAVLWDKVHHNLMYIVTTKDGLAKIVVNAPYGIKRQPDSLDVVINAYRVKKVALEDDIRGGKLEIIEGGL
ncbi:phage head morphogenesis protein [Salmonella enterica]|nr:phage head morphogenesis protein [Salmonella enterica]EDK5418510.1 phage head morphogenesis protein [Salmonella enterica subsp. enterica serovar Muenchen]ELS8802533.1 minor capsid protein [Salmonella enterica subsp. houtenae serovar 43:z4,z32:-]EAM4424178.1 phage head morphogenesis protein [Salmonella enterica]EAQ9178906.1 phage head morphogenesis protein [Salmonella enterica]